MGSKYAQYLYIYHWNCSPWKFVSLPVKFVRGIAVKTVNLHNESVNHTSVRDLLPENCLLNIDDGDFISLEGITDVDEQFFRHVFTGQEEELALDSESSDDNGEQSDPQVLITELKINTIYSKRDSSLTMDVAVHLLKVYNWFGLNTDIYILYKGSR